MKLEAPVNSNYAAVVVEIARIVPLDNCDYVVGTPLLGFQAIVGKETAVGELGIVFTAETQLSEEFTRLNNLYRHTELNADPTAKPQYLEDNRRVKALKFRGHRSDCLFLYLDSLAYTGADLDQLQPGDTFDKLNGHDICEKYVIKRPHTGTSRAEKQKQKIFKRVDEKMLPEHYDTENFFRNRDAIPGHKQVIITQKLHGTSVRIGNTIVKRKLTFRDRIAAKLGVRVQATEFDNVYGSRKVIKDPHNPNQNHYYGSDIWGEEGAKLDGLVPENYIVYGELIGWTKDGAPIQKNYTYGVPDGTCELYVYRVAIVNGQGRIADLAWDQVKEFCTDLGLKHVVELWRGPLEDFNPDGFLDIKFSEFIGVGVPLAKESPCDEGVCVRVDGLAPYILKAKSPAFLRHETKMLDQEAADLEADGSDVDAAAA
jgi:RNA ligase